MFNFSSIIVKTVYEGKYEEIENLINKALKHGLVAYEVYDYLYEGLKKAFFDFKKDKLFLPQLACSFKTFEKGKSILKPLIDKKIFDSKIKGKIIIGTVEGDIHEYGKNLVSIFLTSSGFEVIDLGINVPAKEFIEKAKNENADLIASSVAIAVCKHVQKDIVDMLKKEGLRKFFKTIIGGGAASKQWCKEIDADGFGVDAEEAVEVASSLVKKKGV